MSRPFAFHSLAFVTLALAGCPNKDEKSQSAPPPPPPPTASVAAAGACASGGGQVADSVSAPFFPRTVAGYCLDPQGETKTYGENAKHERDEVCTTLFDGECEVYKGYQLTRVVALRYVDGAGKGGVIDVYLSKFAAENGAYGFFTKRVIADSDPADEAAPRSLWSGGPAGGAAVMGTGRAYLWKGQYVAEIQYNNEQESQEQITKSSGAVLPALAKDMNAKLPGAPGKPAAARALPEAALVSPNAIEFLTKDALGVPNLAPVAVGFYKEGGKRWRMAAIGATDADQAKDAFKLLRTRPGALPVAGVGDEAVAVMIKSGEVKSEYVFARKGALVMGVGDDEYAKDVAARISKEDKTAKLKTTLASSPALAAAPASSAAPSASSAKK